MLAPSVKIERPREKTQSNFVSQIYPTSTLRLQIYETSINHYLAAIRVPLVQVAITVLLYSFPLSELVLYPLSLFVSVLPVDALSTMFDSR